MPRSVGDLAVALGVGRGEVLARRACSAVVGAQVDVVVGQHAMGSVRSAAAASSRSASAQVDRAS